MDTFTDLIAGTVILYNPPDDVFDNILSYVDQVKKLFVIDNSTNYNRQLVNRIEQLKCCYYLDNEGNLGIATALNHAATLAIEHKFKFLLTMDQDTKLSPNFVEKLLRPLPLSRHAKAGIIAPRYAQVIGSNAPNLQAVLFTMTSGNILNLEIYSKVGPFLDELFIDHVDNEYCLRLNSTGFEVIQVNTSLINHVPGNRVKIRFLWFKFSFSSHSPIRLYYFCRNGFYVSNYYSGKFPGFKKIFLRLLVKEFLKIPFEQQTSSRLRMLWEGIRDYKNKKLGPLGSHLVKP